MISSHQEEAQEENFPMNFESGEEKLAYIDRMKSKAGMIREFRQERRIG